MEKRKFDELIKSLNNIRFKGMEEIQYGDVLFYSIYYYEKKKWIFELKAVLAPLLRGIYSVERIGNDGNVFVFSSVYYKRRDHREKFNKVTDLIKNSTVISYQKGRYIKNIFNLYKIVKIYLQVKNLDVNFQLKRFISYWIYACVCEQSEIQEIIDKNNIKMNTLTSYCDVMPIDSMLVQYYKNRRVITITLQHGQFNTQTETGKAAYEKSYSDYFLCFGEYTKSASSNLKIDQTKMIPVGPPEMIRNNMPSAMKSKYTQCFGVIMSSFEFREENISLIECANEFARLFHMKAIIRLHPSLSFEDYRNHIDGDLIEICKNNESLDQFIDRVDFAIVGNSSVFQTFIFKLVPIFRYIVNEKTDVYTGIDWCKYSSVTDGIEIIRKYMNDLDMLQTKMLNTRHKLIGHGDTEQNYKEFYKRIQNEKNIK